MSTVLLAVNPVSGGGRGGVWGDRAEARLRGAGHVVQQVRAADAAALERRLVALLAGGRTDALVAVGGDGMVHLAVNALAGSAVPLGVVATGTGNDFARNVGLPHDDPAASLERVVVSLAADAPPARPVDAVRTSTGRWFVGMLSAGFDAAVNERADRLTRLQGTPRYVVAVLLELARLRPRRYRIAVDRDVRHLDAVLVTVGNTASIGGGMRLAPDALPDDGVLDLLIATPLTRLQLLRVFPRVFRGTHVADEHVEVVRGRVLTIDVDDRLGPVTAYADGERFGPLPITAEVVAGALAVLV